MTDYYVKNDGNDSRTGLSDEQAWENIGSDFNTPDAPDIYTPIIVNLAKRGN